MAAARVADDEVEDVGEGLVACRSSTEVAVYSSVALARCTPLIDNSLEPLITEKAAMTMRRLAGIGLGIILVLVVGCAKPGAETVKVTGTVTDNGSPIEGVAVSFVQRVGVRPPG